MALPVVNASRYTTVVPSTGEEIEFRPFLVKEEKVLMVALESKDNKMIMRTLKDVLTACTFDKLDTDNLASFDLEYLFLQLRSKAVGETAKISLQCRAESCDETATHNVPLEQIKIDVPSDDDKIVMITDDVGMKFKYPSVNDIEKLQVDDVEALTPEEQLDKTMLMILNSLECIFDADNVYPAENETSEQLVEFVDGLNSSQFAKVSAWFSQMPALEHTLEWECKKCKHENSVELRGLQNFFT